jgi:NitT/TauT family transport system permease protein
MAYLEDTRRRSAEKLTDAQLKETLYLFGIKPEWWITALIIIAPLMIWEFLARTDRISSLFFPAPSVILLTSIQLITNGKLTTHVGITLWRVFIGFCLGGISGLILGMAMGWSRSLRIIVDPLIAAAHPVPKIAILPLIMILFGIGESPKIVVIAVATFFPMLINTVTGVRQINPIHFEVAENYGAGLNKIFTRVIIPGSLPLVLTGARLALNMALLVAIAVELVSAQEGLGAMIWLAWQTLRTEELYVSLFVTAALGVILNFLLQRMTLYLVPWQTEQKI